MEAGSACPRPLFGRAAAAVKSHTVLVSSAGILGANSSRSYNRGSDFGGNVLCVRAVQRGTGPICPVGCRDGEMRGDWRPLVARALLGGRAAQTGKIGARRSREVGEGLRIESPRAILGGGGGLGDIDVDIAQAAWAIATALGVASASMRGGQGKGEAEAETQIEAAGEARRGEGAKGEVGGKSTAKGGDRTDANSGFGYSSETDSENEGSDGRSSGSRSSGSGEIEPDLWSQDSSSRGSQTSQASQSSDGWFQGGQERQGWFEGEQARQGSQGSQTSQGWSQGEQTSQGSQASQGWFQGEAGQSQAAEEQPPLGSPSADFLALCHAQLDVLGVALRCCGAQPTRITLYLRTPESFLSGQIELFRVVRRLPGARDRAVYRGSQSTEEEERGMGGEREMMGGREEEVGGVRAASEEEEEEEGEDKGNEPPIAKLPPSIEAVLVQKEVLSLESEGALVVALTRDSFLLGLLVLHREEQPSPSPVSDPVTGKEQGEAAGVAGRKRDRPDAGRSGGERAGGETSRDSSRGVGAVGRLQQWVLRRPERKGEGGRGGKRVEDEVKRVEIKWRAANEGGGQQGQGEGTRERREREVGGEEGGEVKGQQVEWVQLKPYEEEEQRAAVGVARSLALAYVMEQRAWMMQQSLWQRTVTIDSLLDQMRAPLSALRTLGRMLMPQVAKTELGSDLVQGMVSQGDEIGDVLSQLQRALYPLPHPPVAAAAEGAVGGGSATPFTTTPSPTFSSFPSSMPPNQPILPAPPPRRTPLLLPPLADTELPMPPLLLPAPPAANSLSDSAANPQMLGVLSAGPAQAASGCRPLLCLERRGRSPLAALYTPVPCTACCSRCWTPPPPWLLPARSTLQ
ncbi:hypothetical protein CLOP_g18798 [Closterium sp. NIES-67]|nr:hypothetical protein CLOP_g18798 [Closterium sp. NIES-67]